MSVQPDVDVAVGGSPESLGGASRARVPENRPARLRRLRWWARGFAFAVALFSVFPLVLGFGLPMVCLVPLAVALVAFLWPVNIRAVERMDDSPSFATPRVRVALTIAGALVVALAAAFWCLHEEIETELASADPVAWNAKVQRLRDEQSELTKKAGPVPTVERDPEVVRLEQELAQLNDRLYEAELHVLCEFDGTCGTGVPGSGPQYYERVKYRDQLKGQVAELSARVDVRKADLEDQVHRLTEEKDSAENGLVEINRQLASLGPAPPVSKGRVYAMFATYKKHAARAASASAVTCVAFLAIDGLALLFVVRRICQRDAGVPVKSGPDGTQYERIVSSRRKNSATPYHDAAHQVRNERSASGPGS